MSDTHTAPTAAEFCNIIGAKKVAGHWSGSAFGHHPKGIMRERMVFTNEWNTNNYCSVRVMTDPEAKLVLGCQEPAAHGNPNPTVSSGELVTVYRNGWWISEGPWCERICAILEDVKSEIKELAAAERAEHEARSKASQDAAQKSLDAARNVFLTGAAQ